MTSQRAVDLALDLMRMPTLVPILLKQPFPSDLPDLIRIATCNAGVSTAAAEASGVSERMLLSAVIFYLQEVLFSPGADAFRILGVERGASRAQMRLHMRLLLQWLHPDHNPDPAANLLAERVIGAWQELGKGKGAVSKPIERSSRWPGVPVTESPPQHSRRGVRVPWIAVPLEQPRTMRKSKQRSYRLVFALGGAIAMVCIPNNILSSWIHLSNTSMPAASATKGSAAGSGLAHIKVGSAP